MPLPHRRLGRTGIPVSVLGYGAAPIGFMPDPDERAIVSLLHRALELGICFYDTAPDYRNSERLLGRAFGDRRDCVVLATKVGRTQTQRPDGGWDLHQDWTTEGVTRSIERSLRQLGTDRIDLVQLHSPPMWVLEDGGALEGLRRAREQGKVLHMGISADGAEAWRALELDAFATLQLSYSVLQQEPGEELLDFAVEKGVGLIIKQPVANGIADLQARPEHPDWTTKWEVAQRMNLSSLGEPGERTTGALRWLLADSRVSTAIVGTTSRAHLEANAAAAREPLEQEDFERLRAEWRSS